ncbi:MAG: hypothetical protein JSR69_13915 [Proteobacteria bacterium]|nr:hypothetical protein [Pseudomonadota bacterium]
MPDSDPENEKHMASGYMGDFPVFPTKLSTDFVDKKKYVFEAKGFNPFAHPPSHQSLSMH